MLLKGSVLTVGHVGELTSLPRIRVSLLLLNENPGGVTHEGVKRVRYGYAGIGQQAPQLSGWKVLDGA